MTIKVLAARSQTEDYVFVMLCSTIFWLRVDAASEEEIQIASPLPKPLHGLFKSAVSGAIQFLRDCKIPTRDFQKYVAWVPTATGDPEAMYDGKMGNHLDQLYAGLSKIRADADTTDEQIQILDAIRRWHKRANASTLQKVISLLSIINAPPILGEYLKVETQSQAPFLHELKQVVKRLTGVEGTKIPAAKLAEFKERPKLANDVLAFNALTRQLNALSKIAIRDIVRNAGGQMHVKDLKAALKKQKIANSLPDDFDGNVGEDGKWYTRDGSPLSVGGRAPDARIEMNPHYSPSKDIAGPGGANNWYMKIHQPGLKANGKPGVNMVYTTKKLSVQRDQKFEIVRTLLTREKTIVAKWRRDLRAAPDFANQVMAAQCEIMYDTCIRIGGKANVTKDVGATQGLTTLMVGNIKKRGNGILIDYVGKAGVPHTYAIQPATPELRKCLEIIATLSEGKARKDLLWTDGKTEFTALKLRTYFKSISGVPGAHPHNIRHLRGTRLAITELDAARAELNGKRTVNQATVDKAFADALTRVGSMLGHVKGVGATQKATWQTAVKNYVDPSVMHEFYADYLDRGVRPNTVVKALK